MHGRSIKHCYSTSLKGKSARQMKRFCIVSWQFEVACHDLIVYSISISIPNFQIFARIHLFCSNSNFCSNNIQLAIWQINWVFWHGDFLAYYSNTPFTRYGIRMVTISNLIVSRRVWLSKI